MLQVLQTDESFGVHHSSAVDHQGGHGGHGGHGGGGRPVSFQTVTVVHPKKTAVAAAAGASEEAKYLPPQITLHTTARPGKAKLPPHMKNEDTVVLSLPDMMRPTDVPDGSVERFWVVFFPYTQPTLLVIE